MGPHLIETCKTIKLDQSQGLCLVVHAYNPNTREMEAEGHEFQVSWCYIVGPCLNKHLIILRDEGDIHYWL